MSAAIVVPSLIEQLENMDPMPTEKLLAEKPPVILFTKKEEVKRFLCPFHRCFITVRVFTRPGKGDDTSSKKHPHKFFLSTGA